MALLSIRTVAERDRLVIVVAGECDVTGKDALAESVFSALAAAPVVVLDFAEVGFLDSSGIHVLVLAHQRARGEDRELYLTGAVGLPATVLDLTGLGQLLAPPQPLVASWREGSGNG